MNHCLIALSTNECIGICIDELMDDENKINAFIRPNELAKDQNYNFAILQIPINVNLHLQLTKTTPPGNRTGVMMDSFFINVLR